MKLSYVSNKLYLSIIILISFYGFVNSNNISKCIKTDIYCFCDEKCLIYNDCCITDLKARILSKPVSTYLDIFSCIEFDEENLQIVSKCKNGYSKFKNQCENVKISQSDFSSEIIPVVQDDVIYYNEFCAKCNDLDNWTPVTTEAKCNENFTITTYKSFLEFYKSGQCRLSYGFPKRSRRLCYPNLIRTCPDFNSNYSYDCSIGKEFFLMHSDNAVYRNEFCCRCWNKTCRFQSQAFLSSDFIFNLNQWNDITLYNLTNSTNPSKKSKEYIKLICSTISSMALIILILVYCVLKVYHNYNGYLTICLALSTLLFYWIIGLIEILSIYLIELNCQIIGLIIYYFALSKFIWMSIYSSDLIYTFVKSPMSKRTINKKIFISYCLIGFVGPLILIIPAGILNLIDSFNNDTIINKIKPGFQKPFCWFGSLYTFLGWFYIPAFISLLWDFIACAIIFKKLNEANKNRKSCEMGKTNSNSSSTLWLCIRLSSVFCLYFIIQLIMMVFKNEWIRTIFDSVNSLHGLFMAICFMWNARFKSVVMNSWQSVKQGYTRTTNLTQTRTRSREKSASPNKIEIETGDEHVEKLIGK